MRFDLMLILLIFFKLISFFFSILTFKVSFNFSGAFLKCSLNTFF